MGTAQLGGSQTGLPWGVMQLLPDGGYGSCDQDGFTYMAGTLEGQLEGWTSWSLHMTWTSLP